MAIPISIPGEPLGKGRCAVLRQCLHCEDNFIARNGAQSFCSVACRFWHKVDRRGPHDCWPWTAHLNKDGYGSFDKIARQASRVAYILTHGDIPDDILVCHRCDNRRCCNPKHLWLGTPAANIVDCVKKLRRVGTKAAGPVLTDEKVVDIRNRLEAGELPRELAEAYSLNPSTVQRIKSGRAWPHITRGLPVTLSPRARERMRTRVVELQQAGRLASFARRRVSR